MQNKKIPMKQNRLLLQNQSAIIDQEFYIFLHSAAGHTQVVCFRQYAYF